MLVAVRRTDEKSAAGTSIWECLCDCGKTCVSEISSLARGHKKSCGCAAFNDLTGRRFGKLLVIKRLPENVGEKVAWFCQCDCGNTTHSTTDNLRNGKSMSCGCVRTKHNGKGTRLYRIYTGMKDRCTNTNSKYWKRYGGRGISICQAWLDDFATFRDWAMANGYAPGLTIDRIDNDGGYCPENCQWLTLLENATKSNR